MIVIYVGGALRIKTVRPVRIIVPETRKIVRATVGPKSKYSMKVLRHLR